MLGQLLGFSRNIKYSQFQCDDKFIRHADETFNELDQEQEVTYRPPQEMFGPQLTDGDLDDEKRTSSEKIPHYKDHPDKKTCQSTHSKKGITSPVRLLTINMFLRPVGVHNAGNDFKQERF